MTRKSALALAFAALGLLAITGCAAPTPEPTATPLPSPTPTPVPAPTDTPTAEAPSPYELAKQFEGDWAGEWHNETFDTRGDAVATIVVREDGTFDLTLDLNGMVFGFIDPPAVTFTGRYGDMQGADLSVNDDPTFGDATLTITADGQVTGRLEDLMGAGGTLDITGTITPDRFDLRYVLSISGLGAEGTVVLEHSG
jgi:hypothetical protein